MSVLLTGRNPIKTIVTKTETITETKTGSVTAYPSAYDSTNYSYASVSGMTNPVGKDSSNTTYATINLKIGSAVETYVYFPFDFSSIPENATITSISCKARGYVSNQTSSRVSVRQMQLFTGTTAKGSASTLTTEPVLHTIACGTWTRAELQNCRIRLYARRGTSGTSTTYNMRFYGAEITVNYSYEYSYTVETEEEVWI